MTKDEEGGSPADADDPTYRLSLQGEGITVDREISGDMAREIVSVVMGGGEPVRRGARAVRPGGAGGAAMSVREFIDEAGAKKNPQIITAIGQYLLEYEGQDRFSRADVKGKFAQAGEPMPANVGRDVSLAVTSGWVAGRSRNEFYVTDSGRRAIESRFEGQRIRRPRRRAGKKASPKKESS